MISSIDVSDMVIGKRMVFYVNLIRAGGADDRDLLFRVHPCGMRSRTSFAYLIEILFNS
jgi:hypothetical protein